MPAVAELLAVDDNRADLRLIEEALSEWATPHRLHVAVDGGKALEFLRARSPAADLVLLDLYLSDRSGFDVLTEIKSDPSLVHTPVLVVSATLNPADEPMSYERGADAFIQKPCDFTAFCASLRAAEWYWMALAREKRSTEPPHRPLEFEESVADWVNSCLELAETYLNVAGTAVSLNSPAWGRRCCWKARFSLERGAQTLVRSAASYETRRAAFRMRVNRLSKELADLERLLDSRA